LIESFDQSIIHRNILTTIMRKLFLLLLPAFLLTSCRTEDNPSGPGNTTTSGPKTGSTFSYDYVVRGAENEVLDEGTSLRTLVKANASAYGKSNVWIYVDDEGDTNWYAKEANGNVSTYVNQESAEMIGLAQGFWINFPTSGSGGEDRVIAQQEITYQGVPAVLRATLTSEFEGNESITIGTKPYAVKRAGSEIALDVLVGGEVMNSGLLMSGSFWWIPDLNVTAGSEQEIDGENTVYYAEEMTEVNIK
jgi:hypothetical protein